MFDDVQVQVYQFTTVTTLHGTWVFKQIVSSNKFVILVHKTLTNGPFGL